MSDQDDEHRFRKWLGRVTAILKEYQKEDATNVVAMIEELVKIEQEKKPSWLSSLSEGQMKKLMGGHDDICYFLRHVCLPGVVESYSQLHQNLSSRQELLPAVGAEAKPIAVTEEANERKAAEGRSVAMDPVPERETALTTRSDVREVVAMAQGRALVRTFFEGLAEGRVDAVVGLCQLADFQYRLRRAVANDGALIPGLIAKEESRRIESLQRTAAREAVLLALNEGSTESDSSSSSSSGGSMVSYGTCMSVLSVELSKREKALSEAERNEEETKRLYEEAVQIRAEAAKKVEALESVLQRAQKQKTVLLQVGSARQEAEKFNTLTADKRLHLLGQLRDRLSSVLQLFSSNRLAPEMLVLFNHLMASFQRVLRHEGEGRCDSSISGVTDAAFELSVTRYPDIVVVDDCKSNSVGTDVDVDVVARDLYTTVRVGQETVRLWRQLCMSSKDAPTRTSPHLRSDEAMQPEDQEEDLDKLPNHILEEKMLSFEAELRGVLPQLSRPQPKSQIGLESAPQSNAAGHANKTVVLYFDHLHHKTPAHHVENQNRVLRSLDALAGLLGGGRPAHKRAQLSSSRERALVMMKCNDIVCPPLWTLPLVHSPQYLSRLWELSQEAIKDSQYLVPLEFDTEWDSDVYSGDESDDPEQADSSHRRGPGGGGLQHTVQLAPGISAAVGKDVSDRLTSLLTPFDGDMIVAKVIAKSTNRYSRLGGGDRNEAGDGERRKLQSKPAPSPPAKKLIKATALAVGSKVRTPYGRGIVQSIAAQDCDVVDEVEATGDPMVTVSLCWGSIAHLLRSCLDVLPKTSESPELDAEQVRSILRKERDCFLEAGLVGSDGCSMTVAQLVEEFPQKARFLRLRDDVAEGVAAGRFLCNNSFMYRLVCGCLDIVNVQRVLGDVIGVNQAILSLYLKGRTSVGVNAGVEDAVKAYFSYHDDDDIISITLGHPKISADGPKSRRRRVDDGGGFSVVDTSKGRRRSSVTEEEYSNEDEDDVASDEAEGEDKGYEEGGSEELAADQPELRVRRKRRSTVIDASARFENEDYDATKFRVEPGTGRLIRLRKRRKRLLVDRAIGTTSREVKFFNPADKINPQEETVRSLLKKLMTVKIMSQTLLAEALDKGKGILRQSTLSAWFLYKRTREPEFSRIRRLALRWLHMRPQHDLLSAEEREALQRVSAWDLEQMSINKPAPLAPSLSSPSSSASLPAVTTSSLFSAVPETNYGTVSAPSAAPAALVKQCADFFSSLSKIPARPKNISKSDNSLDVSQHIKLERQGVARLPFDHVLLEGIVSGAAGCADGAPVPHFSAEVASSSESMAPTTVTTITTVAAATVSTVAGDTEKREDIEGEEGQVPAGVCAQRTIIAVESQTHSNADMDIQDEDKSTAEATLQGAVILNENPTLHMEEEDTINSAVTSLPCAAPATSRSRESEHIHTAETDDNNRRSATSMEGNGELTATSSGMTVRTDSSDGPEASSGSQVEALSTYVWQVGGASGQQWIDVSVSYIHDAVLRELKRRDLFQTQLVVDIKLLELTFGDKFLTNFIQTGMLRDDPKSRQLCFALLRWVIASEKIDPHKAYVPDDTAEEVCDVCRQSSRGFFKTHRSWCRRRLVQQESEAAQSDAEASKPAEKQRRDAAGQCVIKLLPPGVNWDVVRALPSDDLLKLAHNPLWAVTGRIHESLMHIAAEQAANPKSSFTETDSAATAPFNAETDLCRAPVTSSSSSSESSLALSREPSSAGEINPAALELAHKADESRESTPSTADWFAERYHYPICERCRARCGVVEVSVMLNCSTCPCRYHKNCLPSGSPVGETPDPWVCHHCIESRVPEGREITTAERRNPEFMARKWLLAFSNPLRRWRLVLVVRRGSDSLVGEGMIAMSVKFVRSDNRFGRNGTLLASDKVKLLLINPILSCIQLADFDHPLKSRKRARDQTREVTFLMDGNDGQSLLPSDEVAAATTQAAGLLEGEGRGDWGWSRPTQSHMPGLQSGSTGDTNIGEASMSDTFISDESLQAALCAAGVACRAVDIAICGENTNVFACIRPPGHHAGRFGVTAGCLSTGFCLLNNAAIAAIYARVRWGIERVAVVDIDVHFGNGTAELLKGDPRAFFASVHMVYGEGNAGFEESNGLGLGKDVAESRSNVEDGFYPSLLGATELTDNYVSVGVMPVSMIPSARALRRALDHVLISEQDDDDDDDDELDNVPVARSATMELRTHGGVVNGAYYGAAGYRRAITELIIPRMQKFGPELLIISAGFDGFHSDPVGGELRLSLEDYEWSTNALVAAVSAPASPHPENISVHWRTPTPAKVISLLEGGYDVSANSNGLAKCVAAHVQALRES